MRPVQCDRPSLHAVVAAGLSILVVATAVPLDVIVVVVDVAVVVVAAVVIAVGAVTAVVVVSSASRLGGESCWVRTWRPLVAATLLTRAHLPPRGDIARFCRARSHGCTHFARRT